MKKLHESDLLQAFVYTGAADAIAYPGTALINRSGAVDACTLATPTPGTDDGKVIRIVNGAAYANKVTTAANKINDGTSSTKDTITFAAYAGASIKLMAYNGMWYVIAKGGDVWANDW
jgi:hypothetical protein